MTYKYGARKISAELGDLSLPTFQWIGLSQADIHRLEISLSFNHKHYFY